MSITGNIAYFFQDVQRAHALLDATTDSRMVWGSGLSYAKNYSVAVLNMTCVQAIAHYPKTILTALIISSIAAVLLMPSLGSLLVLGANCLFFYKYEKALFNAIRLYNAADVSEWTAPIETKQGVILLIEGREVASAVCQAAGSFFSRFAFWR